MPPPVAGAAAPQGQPGQGSPSAEPRPDCHPVQAGTRQPRARVDPHHEHVEAGNEGGTLWTLRRPGAAGTAGHTARAGLPSARRRAVAAPTCGFGENPPKKSRRAALCPLPFLEEALPACLPAPPWRGNSRRPVHPMPSPRSPHPTSCHQRAGHTCPQRSVTRRSLNPSQRRQGVVFLTRRLSRDRRCGDAQDWGWEGGGLPLCWGA